MLTVWALNQGMEPHRKEQVLEPEPFEYWKLKPLIKLILIPAPHRNPYLN